jgi:hypothetical protein
MTTSSTNPFPDDEVCTMRKYPKMMKMKIRALWRWTMFPFIRMAALLDQNHRISANTQVLTNQK